VGQKLNRTHQLLAYIVDENLIGENIHTRMKYRRTVHDTSKVDGLDGNTEN
jgi:hypothetical protein